jgi:magnesium chelatase family protein
VPAQKPEHMQKANAGESAAAMRARVVAARSRMLTRQKCANAALSSKGVQRHATPSKEALALLNQAVDELGLSARAYDRILKVARTITDLDSRNDVGLDDVSEAIGYRVLDRVSS